MILHFRDGNLENPTVWKKGTADLNGKYEVEPKKLSRRSNQQNAYYWAVVISMCQEGFKDLGNEFTKQEIHEFLKARFNFVEIVNYETSEMIQVPISTTRLTKSRFSEYIEQIQRFAAEFLNIVIPDPGIQLDAFNEGGNN